MGTELIVSVETVKDWSVIDQYDKKIIDAQSLIQRSEAQLAVRFVDIHRQLSELDKAITSFAAKRRPSDPIITVDVTIREVDLDSQVNFDAFDSLQKVKEPEDSLKKIFKKIAKFTHPDKLGDERLFKEAKKALKQKNRHRLLEILNLVTADYDELVRLKLEEYKSITESVQYLMAVDFFSGNESLIKKAESYYYIVLNQTIRNKVELFNAMIKGA